MLGGRAGLCWVGVARFFSSRGPISSLTRFSCILLSWSGRMHACVRACVRARAFFSERVRVYVLCLIVCVRACVREKNYCAQTVRACLRACVQKLCVRACT